MHVHIVQSEFVADRYPSEAITARTLPFPISWSPPPLVEQPQKYGVRIHEGEPQSLPAWAQLGLDETPLQYAPKLRGGYAAGEKQVTHYSSGDKRQATSEKKNNVKKNGVLT